MKNLKTQLMTKDKDNLTDKLNNLQRAYDELKENYNNDKIQNEKQINLLTQENNSFKSNLNSNEKSMKSKIVELESLLMDKTSQHEKDQILWEGKIKFVEQQRDNLKKEQIDSNKRFEAMLETIQKKSNSEKERLESTTQNSISNLEQKYNKQIKDIQDNHNKLYTELINNNKELEKELKSLRLESEMSKNKNFNPGDLTKKLDEINKEKEKLKQREEAIKNEYDGKYAELMSTTDKDKEVLKKRITDIERSLREAEGKRGALLLELEKEKAKWNIEKDNLTTKYNELSDKLINLERKNENLLRENEKLKNEKNMLRKINMKNDSKYSLMYRDGSSVLSNSNISNPSGKTFTGISGSSLQKDSFKFSGDSDIKSDVDSNSNNSSKSNNKNYTIKMRGLTPGK